MAENGQRNVVKISVQGRLVIPAALCKVLNLQSGDRLVMCKVGESLVLEHREAIEQRLRNRFRHIPKNVILWMS